MIEMLPANMNHSTSTHIPGRMLLQWHITDRCNLLCSHCYQDSHHTAEPTFDELLLILEQFKEFIRSCRERNGSRRFKAHVTVTGGEPFVREDFVDLLERLAADSRLFSFAILTNGTLLTPAIVRSLNRLKPVFVQVSIDGARETHDRIRGAGSYDQAVEGLKLVVRGRIPTHISFTAHRDNFQDFPHVARLGSQLGVTRVWSDRMVPCGRGGVSEDMVLNPDETREYLKLMQKEQQRGWLRKSRVTLYRSLQFIVSGEQPYRCAAGDTLVTVLPNGDVCPCRRMPLVVGNLFNENLEKIYAESELLRNLRDRTRVADGCEGCFYSRTCNGGSRCLASAVHKDPFRADPGCWLAAGNREIDRNPILNPALSLKERVN
jgi:radical SAM protein with 4Fe4S-binding SPASM domain